MNPFHVGIGTTVVIWLNVIILAFLWRALAAKLALSDNERFHTLGAALGSSL